MIEQPIPPRRQRLRIKRINDQLPFDQAVAPVAFIFALQDPPGWSGPKSISIPKSPADKIIGLLCQQYYETSPILKNMRYEIERMQRHQ